MRDATDDYMVDKQRRGRLRLTIKDDIGYTLD
jgi:hypothetical protein